MVGQLRTDSAPALEIMDASREEDELLREWIEFLELQTRVLGPREIAWLCAHRLSANAAGILEVGSANGSYGTFLARNLPHVPIFGLEANSRLITDFQKWEAAPPNYSIRHCEVGVDSIPEEMQGRFSQCLLRFVLQHSPTPKRKLKAIDDALPAGGHVYAIEEDDGFFVQHPVWPPFAEAVDIWRRVCAAGGSDSRIGRRLPNLVGSVGLKVDHFAIVLRNNVEMGERFFRALHQDHVAVRLINLNLVSDSGAAPPLAAAVAARAQVGAPPDVFVGKTGTDASREADS